MGMVLALDSLESYTDQYIACHECDLVHPVRRLGDGEIAACGRCGAVLYQQRKDSLNRSLAFALTGLILFIAANMFPLLTFEMEGRAQSNRLIDGTLAFWQSGYWELALLVFTASVAVPLMSLISILYVLGSPETQANPKGVHLCGPRDRPAQALGHVGGFHPRNHCCLRETRRCRNSDAGPVPGCLCRHGDCHHPCQCDS